MFFEWDQSNITPEAATILDNAVSAYANCGMASVMLAGHTDTSGPRDYNVGLSERRNDSVQSYLTGRGVPSARISTEAFGESQLRVPDRRWRSRTAEPPCAGHVRTPCSGM